MGKENRGGEKLSKQKGLKMLYQDKNRRNNATGNYCEGNSKFFISLGDTVYTQTNKNQAPFDYRPREPKHRNY
jgi:hypothetical protein